tara:strand:- start:207 stop:389 length:183 start_codon:yes stop_codon:yes gene_type:complete
MAEDDVFDRLTQMIEIVSNKRKLSDAQKRTIISLVEMIRSGDTLSDDKLMGYFEHIGGGR